MFKKIALSLCFTLFLGLLSACSPEGFLRPKIDESVQEKNSESNNKNDKIGSPVALPPTFPGAAPLEPGQTETQYLPNGLPALKPAKGINVDTLFSEQLKNENERFSRVENAVIDLRKEFEAYKPSIVRLAAVESDIQNLMKELEVLLQETPTPDTTPPLDLISGPDPTLSVEQLQPEPEEPEIPIQVEKQPEKPKGQTPQPPPKQPPPINYDGVIAQNLRAGEHADKVRIVLDTNQKTPHSFDLDNNEKLILIEMPQAKWVGETKKRMPDSKLLESYEVEPINDGKGSLIIITLKKATNLIKENHLSPEPDTPYHRIYFDLKL